MLRFKTLFISALLLVWLTPLIILAQPTIQGAQTGTLGPGDYIVVGDIRVPAGESLTIEPGTIFYHSGHFFWRIYGEIQIAGTTSEQVQFLRQQPIEDHRWGGLRFEAGASDNSVIEYCVLDNCKNSYYPDYYGGAIYSNGVDLVVRHTRIGASYASSGGGAYITNGASVEFDHCMVLKNQAGNGGGLYFNNSPNCTVKNSLIARNKSTST